MKLNKIIFPLFILLAVIQLYVPASMIWAREVTLTQGKIYKFKTAPVDPYDPFRGKFITLRFDLESEKFDKEPGMQLNQSIYVVLEEDPNGFAKIKNIQMKPPAAGINYVKASAWNTYGDFIQVDFPFDRYYMEESKAKPAEQMYNDMGRDEEVKVYALVAVRNGDAVIKDVMIDGRSIKDVVADQ